MAGAQDGSSEKRKKKVLESSPIKLKYFSKCKINFGYVIFVSFFKSLRVTSREICTLRVKRLEKISKRWGISISNCLSKLQQPVRQDVHKPSQLRMLVVYRIFFFYLTCLEALIIIFNEVSSQWMQRKFHKTLIHIHVILLKCNIKITI